MNIRDRVASQMVSSGEMIGESVNPGEDSVVFGSRAAVENVGGGQQLMVRDLVAFGVETFSTQVKHKSP